MKKLIVASAMMLGILNASAQTKIGHINSDEVLSLMPEAAKAQTELQELQASLAKRGQDLQAEADKKVADYMKDSATLSASMKEVVKSDITRLYQRLQGYDVEMQETMNKEAQAKVGPLRAKILDAIKAVAKEKGYAYVIDEASNALLVSPPADDLLPSVKAKLGIKDTPTTPKRP